MVFRKDQINFDEPIDFEGQYGFNLLGLIFKKRDLTAQPLTVGEIGISLSGEVVYQFSNEDAITVINSSGKIPSSLVSVNVALDTLSQIQDTNIQNIQDNEFLIRKSGKWVNKPFYKELTVTDPVSPLLIAHNMGYPPNAIIIDTNGDNIPLTSIGYPDIENDILLTFDPIVGEVKIYLR